MPSDAAGPSTHAVARKPAPSSTHATVEAEWRAVAFDYAPEYRDCLLGAVCVGITDPRGAPPTLRSGLTALPVRSHTAIVGLAGDDGDGDYDPEPEPEPTPAQPIRIGRARRVTFSEPPAPRRPAPPPPTPPAEERRARPHPAAAFDPVRSPAQPSPAAAERAARPMSIAVPPRPAPTHRPMSWADAATVAKWPWGARRGSGASTPTSPVGPVTPTAGVFEDEVEREAGKAA